MHKEIERAALRITQAMEKNRKLYSEAQEWLNETGQDRYWNKMVKLDAEYEELKNFILPEEKVAVESETIRKLRELRRQVKCIKSKWEYLRTDLPISAEVIGIDDLFRDIRLD